MVSSSPQNPNPNEGWTIVSHKRNRNKATKPPCLSHNPPQSQTLTPTPTPTSWTPLDSESDPARHSKLHLKLQSSLRKVRSSKFYRQFVSQLHSPKIESLLSSFHEMHLIIYGIGNIESSESSRLQLSLALLLRQEFGARISSVEVFDPVLSATECSVLEELGFPVMRFNELCRREVKVPTLFFMPHCTLQLYDNLLGANWGEGLKRIAILGNSFGLYGGYVEAGLGIISAIINDAGPRVIGVRRFVREVEIEGVGRVKIEGAGRMEIEGLERGREEEEYGFFEAFHSTSWHFFELGDNCDVNNFFRMK